MATMVEQMQGLERRVQALENGRARNIPVVEPTATMQIGPGAVAPHNLALPDYLLAPTPDYRIREPCPCCASLRAELQAVEHDRELALERAEKAERKLEEHNLSIPG